MNVSVTNELEPLALDFSWLKSFSPIPSVMYRRNHIAYELPSNVKSLNDGWLATYQASMALAGIFVGVEVPLLFFFKTDSNFPNGIGSDAQQALLVLAYINLFFSLSTAMSALILTQELLDGGPDPLRGCEGRPLLIWLTWHWMFSLIGGTIFPIVQLLLYVWLEESNFVRITLSVIAVFAALPITVFLIPLPSGNGKRHNIVALDTRTTRS